ncbi:hypothetical protein KAU08_03755 [bacterium]|nr:hypothetical protein [bacterium]
MDQQLAKDITSKLKQRGVSGQCPMCGNTRFSVNALAERDVIEKVDGLLGILNKLDKKGSHEPVRTVITFCTNCGFVAEFALNVIDVFLEKV